MIDFPASPVVGQKFTAAGVTWTWDGVKWGLTAAAGAPITIGDTPPASPVIGALWYDSVGGQMYVWYNDGNSSQWAPVVNQGGASASALSYVAPPSAASWTQRNFGGSTALTNVANGVNLYDTNNAALATAIRGITLAAPSTPYTIDANISATAMLNNSSDFYLEFGIGWTDGTKIQTLVVVLQSHTATYMINLIETYTFSNYTTNVGPVSGTAYAHTLDFGNVWFRMADNGTNITLSISSDGVSFLPNYTVAKSSGYLGSSGYSNVGVFFNAGLLGNPGYGTLTLRSWYQH